PKQIKIDFFAKSGSHPHTKSKNDKLTKALVKFLIQDAQPISLAVSSNFHEFIKELDPMFSLPNEKCVKQIIHILYNKSFEIMQKKLKDSITYCSLTTDLWTSCNRQEYLGITCLWLDSDFKIHEVLLSLTYIRYPYTADIIKEKLEETIEAWGLTEK
ncbi:1478_t:CDS:1, partial [Gigaspora margarita]